MDFDPDREKLLHFLQVGGGGGGYRRRQHHHHHHHHHQPSRAGTTRRGKKKKSFCCLSGWWCLKRALGTRTTTTQKVLLFAPMVWFAVSVLSLARFRTSEGERSVGVAKTLLTGGGASERGERRQYRPQNHNPKKMHSNEENERILKSSVAHEKAPIPVLTFESDEKMRAEREREEAMSAQNRHPCLNNGVHKVKRTSASVTEGGKGRIAIGRYASR